MWKTVAVAAVVAVAATGATYADATAGDPPPRTAPVERGTLSDMVSQYGTLTYRARADGSAYAVFNRMRGTYTALPAAGDTVDCGDVLYRVNDRPVLLLCGSTPAYRSLSEGDRGRDVAELNANLGHTSSDRFDSATESALATLQARVGAERTGSLALGRAVFLPGPVRIAAVTAELGESARPGTRVAKATSDTLEVQVSLDPSQQAEVKAGDRARITLPGNRQATGRVSRLGSASTPASIGLDDPHAARGLDRAPVQVEITTRGVENALNVPVTAIVGRSGGGFAVEVVRAGGRRDLVAVKLGLFDTAGGRVQVVQGDLRVGDRVVVPSS
jgi:hypothetical protein